jgi:translation initiation factor 3 subunit M
LLYVRSLPPSSQAGQTAAIEAIAVALRLSTIFDFDPLFKLDTVLALKNHELFSLLLIFLNDGFPEYQAWERDHPGSLEKYRASRIYLCSDFGFMKIDRYRP